VERRRDRVAAAWRPTSRQVLVTVGHLKGSALEGLAAGRVASVDALPGFGRILVAGAKPTKTSVFSPTCWSGKRVKARSLRK
jgi:hypothetical protein